MSARDGTFRASFLDARTQAILDAHANNSPDEIAARSGSYIADKLVTLTGAGAPSVTNLFLVTGGVVLYNLYGVFEDVTEVVDIDAVHLELWDGTNEVALTIGVECDGVVVNSLLIRSDTSGNALVKLDSDQVRIDEASKQTILSAVVVNAKEGAPTYVRMSHTNADTNLNCQIRWYCEWRHLGAHADGTVVAV